MNRRKNTSVITGRIMQNALMRGIFLGAVFSAAMFAVFLFSVDNYIFSSALRGTLILFALIVILSLIPGWIKASKFKNALKVQAKDGIGAFDDEVLKPITADSTAWLGENWVLLFHDGKYIPVNRAHIISADSINERKEGMKKLWMRLTTNLNETPSVCYAACEPDALAVVTQWLRPAPEKPSGIDLSMPSSSVTSAPASQPDPAGLPNPEPAVPSASAPETKPADLPNPEPVVIPAPVIELPHGDPAGDEPIADRAVTEPVAAEPVTAPKPLPAGSCPFCFGPNEPGAEVCQWCGCRMK